MIKIKKLFKILLLSLLFTSFLGETAVKADEYFVINEYNVDIIVNENNTYDVVETLLVEFTSPRHGIYREIPRRGIYQRVIDGEEMDTRYNAKIKVLGVEGYKYEVYNEGVNKVIKIGDADVFVSGEQEYKIYYTMDFGDDGIAEFDEVYLNLIGNGWDTNIYSAYMRVIMPKEFDAASIGLSSGYEGTEGSNILDYKVIGNTISIKTNEMLHPREGVTLRLQLPEGYFIGERVPYDWSNVLYIGTAALFIFTLFLWFAYGRDEKLYTAVEFYPPENLTPAEIGYVVDGTVDTKDAISLLIYWADKGYIRIEERTKKDFYLIKLKNLPMEAEYYEHKMFSSLFKKRPKINFGDLLSVITGKKSVEDFEKELTKRLDDSEILSFVRVKDLENVFYSTIDSVKKMIRDKYKDQSGNKIYTRKSIVAKVVTFLVFMLPVLFAAIIIKAPVILHPDSAIVGAVFFTIFTSIAFGFLDYIVRSWHSTKKFVNILRTVFVVAILVVFYLITLVIVLPIDTEISLLPGFLIVTASYVMGILGLFMHKRTPELNSLQEKILGLKMFLNDAEKDRINTLVDENPQYFYDILPYAYVLGITNKWAKQFEHIAMEPPSWYLSAVPMTHFSASAFESSLSRSFNSMSGSMSSSPSSSSGGGGGFSGGGGGGGGGGSW